MFCVVLLAFKPQALPVLRRRLCGVYSLFLLSMCVVVMLAFKAPGSVRSKAAIMCCLCVVHSLLVFCFQCGLLHC